MKTILDKHACILLVEDDVVDIQDIQRTFRKCNITSQLHIAKNGLEALNKLKGLNGERQLVPKPTMILLDINMPKMNGIEFLKMLRMDTELFRIPVYILTSSDDDRDKIAACNLAVSGYILKPIQLNEFTDLLTH